MEHKLSGILARNRIMAVATLRPDGWPQATYVSYVNDEYVIYFLVSRTSQKFRNIAADDRVSIAIGTDATAASRIEGLSMSARASEARDEPYRSQALARLSARHPGDFDPKTLDISASALMRALPEVMSIVDFSQGLGHADDLTIGTAHIVEMAADRRNNWGPNPAL